MFFTSGWAEGTLADYLGLPTKVEGISVSALPGRAYGLIYNEWFRNQNVTQPTLVEVTDATTTGKNDGSATNDSAITLAKPLKAAKVFDYYTGALPEPQKGEPITIPLGDTAKIYAYEENGAKFEGSQDLSNFHIYNEDKKTEDIVTGKQIGRAHV